MILVFLFKLLVYGFLAFGFLAVVGFIIAILKGIFFGVTLNGQEYNLPLRADKKIAEYAIGSEIDLGSTKRKKTRFPWFIVVIPFVIFIMFPFLASLLVLVFSIFAFVPLVFINVFMGADDLINFSIGYFENVVELIKVIFMILPAIVYDIFNNY